MRIWRIRLNKKFTLMFREFTDELLHLMFDDFGNKTLLLTTTVDTGRADTDTITMKNKAKFTLCQYQIILIFNDRKALTTMVYFYCRIELLIIIAQLISLTDT